ncbi:MAG: hypothetical protein HOE48_21770 [Candidatus Latescibacteria bacterium]|jgi:hypothetical protein|nr:hypothetical protein [Candidatus Latescibacterota bacterium]MBT4140554.1 hypothetical protein [Candidatus Latescibacterota bacterium]
MIDIGIMVALIILASAVHKYIERRGKDSIPSDAESRLIERIDELERRLTDIQDVMITIDEKLDRK